ncbi:hypothetical protein HK414_17040 [Ramlibacter terrae]|uniref:Uncharacterized protein n=1 Tax=Ramlibacter terrae TaxID=2732511 RepID=A0ABX6NZF4_9BURK|nr:hypothetical protein HK414_17040 [Ramlibacter terrae]
MELFALTQAQLGDFGGKGTFGHGGANLRKPRAFGEWIVWMAYIHGIHDPGQP